MLYPGETYFIFPMDLAGKCRLGEKRKSALQGKYTPITAECYLGSDAEVI